VQVVWDYHGIYTHRKRITLNAVYGVRRINAYVIIQLAAFQILFFFTSHLTLSGEGLNPRNTIFEHQNSTLYLNTQFTGKALQPPFRSPPTVQYPNFHSPFMYPRSLKDVPVFPVLDHQSKFQLFWSF
jgi:hypothetical protein